MSKNSVSVHIVDKNNNNFDFSVENDNLNEAIDKAKDVMDAQRDKDTWTGTISHVVAPSIEVDDDGGFTFNSSSVFWDESEKLPSFVNFLGVDVDENGDLALRFGYGVDFPLFKTPYSDEIISTKSDLVAKEHELDNESKRLANIVERVNILISQRGYAVKSGFAYSLEYHNEVAAVRVYEGDDLLDGLDISLSCGDFSLYATTIFDFLAKDVRILEEIKPSVCSQLRRAADEILNGSCCLDVSLMHKNIYPDIICESDEEYSTLIIDQVLSKKSEKRCKKLHNLLKNTKANFKTDEAKIVYTEKGFIFNIGGWYSKDLKAKNPYKAFYKLIKQGHILFDIEGVDYEIFYSDRDMFLTDAVYGKYPSVAINIKKDHAIVVYFDNESRWYCTKTINTTNKYKLLYELIYRGIITIKP